MGMTSPSAIDGLGGASNELRRAARLARGSMRVSPALPFAAGSGVSSDRHGGAPVSGHSGLVRSSPLVGKRTVRKQESGSRSKGWHQMTRRERWFGRNELYRLHQRNGQRPAAPAPPTPQ
jgi:hypothetical protein